MNPRNHKVKETQAATNAGFESKSPSLTLCLLGVKPILPTVAAAHWLNPLVAGHESALRGGR